METPLPLPFMWAGLVGIAGDLRVSRVQFQWGLSQRIQFSQCPLIRIRSIVSLSDQPVPAWWSLHRSDQDHGGISLALSRILLITPSTAMRRVTGKSEDETLIELQSATDSQTGGILNRYAPPWRHVLFVLNMPKESCVFVAHNMVPITLIPQRWSSSSSRVVVGGVDTLWEDYWGESGYDLLCIAMLLADRWFYCKSTRHLTNICLCEYSN